MARIRTVKPEIALHEGLYELESETGLPIRFSWCMLFCHCDREGRFEWRPRRLGTQILPYDNLDFSRVLHALATRGFLVCYRVGDAWFGAIPTFRRHQVVNNKERESEIPEIGQADETWIPGKQGDTNATTTREGRDGNATCTREVKEQAEGKGTEQGTRNKEQGTEGVSPTARAPAGAPPGGNGAAHRFDDFWALYPRRRDKKKARELWIRKRLDERADIILDDVRHRQRHDDQWQRDDGKYIPLPTTYLRGERWEDEFTPPGQGKGQSGIDRWLENQATGGSDDAGN